MTRSLHHTIVVQRTDDGIAIPVLYISEPTSDGVEQLRVVPGLIEYLTAHRARSMTWMKLRARSLGLIHDYLRQRRQDFERAANATPIAIHRYALVEFTNYIRLGTVQNGEDPTGLHWQPCASPDQVTLLVQALDDYIKWQHQNGFGTKLPAGYETWDGTGESPFSAAETVRRLYAAKYAWEFSLLAHVKRTKGSAPSVPFIGQIERLARPAPVKSAKRFPDRYVIPFLSEPFFKDSGAVDALQRQDVVGRLMSILLAGTGKRQCEPLHFWVNDIQIVDGKPRVFLHHPAFSRVETPDGGSVTRETYLKERCGLKPRYLESTKYKAGWKNIKLSEGTCDRLHWLPIEDISQMFTDLYWEYTSNIRPALMRQRTGRGEDDHPFFFVSAGGARHNDDYEAAGDPYTTSAFRNSWERAFNRFSKRRPEAGLVLSKKAGTTPHGLRHLYGATLAKMGLPGPFIQAAMHHTSPHSHKIYTEATDVEINDWLKNGQANWPRSEWENR
ncbi:tyrosine-type recombinase/integrase [Bosea caraganae]|nr:tyrosine-type recombinase/integrase [Bosea caraganae]